MKTKRQLGSLILTLTLVFSLIGTTVLSFPVEVNAEEMLNASTLQVGDHIWMGESSDPEPYWRVLDVDEENQRALILSEYAWGGTHGKKFDSDAKKNSGQTELNDWQGSDMQAYCQRIYEEALKSSPLIVGVNLEETEDFTVNDRTFEPSSLTTADKVFFLSMPEIVHYFDYPEGASYQPLKLYRFSDMTQACPWWTRSAYKGTTDSVGYVEVNGKLGTTGVRPGAYITDYSNTAYFHARPAFYLDLSSDIAATKDDNGDWVIDAQGNSEPPEEIPDAQAFSDITGTVNTSGTVKFNFDETDFAKDPTIYDHTLGRASIAFSLMAYNNSKSILEDVLVTKMGFKDPHTWNNKMEDDDGDKSPYMIAHKKVKLNGRKTELVVVVLRGSYHGEWVDNFDSGTGRVHEGFNRAKNFILEDISNYLNSSECSFDKTAQMKVLVTGHSRGAAVANLIGKALDDGALGSYNLSANDVFVYTFASPNTAMITNSDRDKYKNIFNIVNPEDFVTKVIPAAWGYGRYGITYALPSRTTESKHSGSHIKYSSYLNDIKRISEELCAKQLYQPYSTGELRLASYMGKVTNIVDTIDKYYNMDLYSGEHGSSPSEWSLHDLYKFALGGNRSGNKALEEKSNEYIKKAALNFFGFVGCSTIDFFLVDQIINPEFECAHVAETYYAGMNSLSSYELTMPRHVMFGEVNCPVDVTIRDAEGVIVGQILNNKVNEDVESEDSGVVMQVEGESKQFSIPESADFTIELSGNDTGSMDYTLGERDVDSGEIQRAYYQEVPVTTSTTLTQTITGSPEVEDAELVDNDGTVIEPTAVMENGGAGDLSVEVTVEGKGSAPSVYNLNPGEYVTLKAVTDEYNEFLGWYDNEGQLLSDESDYGVLVRENVSLIAKFTENEAPEDPCKNGHKWNKEYTVDVAATTSAPGWKTIHCSVCGAIKPGSKVEIAQLEITDLPTVKISKPKAAKKKITVKWKKVSKKNLKKIKGIQIQVATDKDFKNIVKTTTAGKKKTSKVVKGLKSKTRYYVRIRAYGATNHYSIWKSKSVKVK